MRLVAASPLPRLRRALATALLVAASVGLPATAGAWTRSPIRVGGSDRFESAVLLSRGAFAPGVPAVVVVSGASFADGLVAGPLAALLGGPVLLTGTESVPESTAAELRRLTPAQVVVVGGEVSVPNAVAEQLAAVTGTGVRRVSGVDRYGTALAAAREFPPAPTPVLAATGAHYADALAGGAIAAADRRPLLLVSPDGMSPALADELRRLQAPSATVLGGVSAVSDAVFVQLASAVPALHRVAGPDRYATAAALGASRPAKRAYLAVGHGWADALAASAVAGPAGAPVLLTEPGCVPSPTVDALRDLGWPDLVGVGGSGVVSGAALAVLPCTPVGDGEVVPGVTVETRRLPGPRVARIVTVDRARFDVVAAPATGRLAGRLPTTQTARRWNAVAAVNGDFFRTDGSPVHASASQGRLLKAPGLTEVLAGFDQVNPAVAGSPSPEVSMILPDGVLVRVDRVNDGARPAGGVALVTREAGGQVSSAGACVVSLLASGPPGPAFWGDTTQASTVSGTVCDGGNVTVGAHDLLIVNGDTPAAGLTPGATVVQTWRLRAEWPGLLDAIGGNCMLVQKGVISGDVIDRPEAFFRERAPRTAVGWRADGQIVLVTVDGRQADWSIGMTPRELADLMRSLGATEAVNLDGGGSTALAVRGVLANRPSDPAGERAVGPALVVVPKGAPTPPVLGTGGGTALASISHLDPMGDPASAGGLGWRR